jgi:ABC-type transporter Mla maintaining outer membrane lipid asymmetry ATPase subunit MlaF
MPPLLQLRGVVKNYGGLRPLRMADLSVRAGEIVTLEGPDTVAASVLVDLITGTTLPDAGDILVSGSPTAAIGDQEAWLAFLEQFGIVNERVVLLDDLTVLQNLAVPLTLDLDPLPEDARHRALHLAAAVGLDAASLDARLTGTDQLTRFRVRLGRALAHDPRLLLVEHPTLRLQAKDARECGQALRLAAGRAAGALVVSGDPRLTRAVGGRNLVWDAATGGAASPRGWRRWLAGA